jgi:hypothetical protein
MKRKFLAVVTAITLLISSLSGVVMAAETGTLTLSPDAITVVNVETPGQVVRYQFKAEHNCVYSFHSISEEDTYAELYNSSGNLLYANDDFYGMNFGIECTLEAGKTYVLEVCFLDTEAEGAFELLTSTKHDLVSKLVIAADCNGEGLWNHSCKKCGYVWNEVIPPTHNYKGGVCTECGKALTASGTCGSNLKWSFDGVACTLRITGTGAMYDFEEDMAPWYEYRDLISNVVVASGATNIGAFAFSGLSELTSVDLPDSITAIGNKAFAYCSQLTAMPIPGAVTTIAAGAFSGCSKLARFDVAGDNSKYSSDEFGVLFDKTKQCLIQAPNGMKDYYAMPDTVTTIGDSAFEGCANLTAIMLSSRVSEIGRFAFSSCSSLKFLSIPASVTVIKADAFSSCDSLKDILFEGDAPALEGTIFEDTTATAYYFSNNQTWTEEYMSECGEGITWTPVYNLRLLLQPQALEKLIGESVTYVVGACGKGLQYTWWVAKPGSNSFSMSSVTGNAYTVVVSEQTVGQKVYCVVKDESGTMVRTKTVTVSAVTELEDGKLSSVTLETEKDSKYFAFTPQYSCYYTIRSYGDYDTYLELFDGQYNLIATADDSIDYNFELRIFLEAGKGYVIGVSAAGQANATFDVTLTSNHDFVITELPATCTMPKYTMYTCQECGYSYKVSVGNPLGHKWSAATCTEPMVCQSCTITEGEPLGHRYTNGVCSGCGDVTVAITQKGRNLSYEDLIYVIDIFELTGVEGVDLTTDAGLLIWSVEEFEALDKIAFDADHANVGLKPYKNTPYYYGSSDGIFTRDLHKEAYYVGYVKLADGSYIYSEPKLYSPSIYAYTMLGKDNTSAETKELCVALLNYISAAQMYFDSNTPAEKLVNKDLTEAQKALNWENISFNLAPDVPANKQVERDTAVFTGTGKNLLFEEMISVVSIFKIDDSVIANAKEYGTIFWTAEQFAALNGVPGVNNIGDGTKTGMSVYRGNAGQWYSQAPAVAAKDMAGTQYYYLGYVVHADGSVSYSGVQSYTVEQYISNTVGKASTSDEMRAFAQWLYVYERAAKNALGNG